MTFALSALISIGPVALVAALVSIVIYYFKYRYAPKQHRSVLHYGLIALGVRALAYVIGAVVAVSVACSSASAGNLCGLVGVLGDWTAFRRGSHFRIHPFLGKECASRDITTNALVP